MKNLMCQSSILSHARLLYEVSLKQLCLGGGKNLQSFILILSLVKFPVSSFLYIKFSFDSSTYEALFIATDELSLILPKSQPQSLHQYLVTSFDPSQRLLLLKLSQLLDLTFFKVDHDLLSTLPN